MFQRPRPRSGLERPERPSEASSTGLKPLDTANGSPNRFNPVPLFWGSLLVPTPLDPLTPLWTPSPKLPGVTVGIFPVLNPNESVPPQTWEPPVAVTGWPLMAEKLTPGPQPPTSPLRDEGVLSSARLLTHCP